jgi:hypothetical protein
MPYDRDQIDAVGRLLAERLKMFPGKAALRSPRCEKHGSALPMEMCNMEFRTHGKWKENKYRQDQVSKGVEPVL